MLPPSSVSTTATAAARPELIGGPPGAYGRRLGGFRVAVR